MYGPKSQHCNLGYASFFLPGNRHFSTTCRVFDHNANVKVTDDHVFLGIKDFPKTYRRFYVGLGSFLDI